MNSNSNSNDGSNKTIVKPTEAQLRYAQFHHKRRAQAVKYRIDRLHQTPLQVQVVTIGKIRRETFSSPIEGEDGYSSVDTTDTSDVEVKAIRLRRPKISVGRRAYLKDSKRQYRRRRRDIQKYGFKGYFVNDDNNPEEAEPRMGENDFVLESDDNFTDNELRKQESSTLSNQPSRKRKTKTISQRSKANSSVDDSYQRFQAACHAMMRNIETSQSKNSPIKAPSKKWTRSKAHVEASKSGQTDFYRYKTSGLVRKSNKNAALLLSYKYYQQNRSKGMDTGASWLTHLPAKQAKRSQNNNYYFQNMADLPHLIQQATTSTTPFSPRYEDIGDGSESVSTLARTKPGPQKFHRLVAYVQHKLIEKEQQQAKLHSNQHYLLPVPNHDETMNQHPNIGQTRTKELAELLSPSTKDDTPSRIRQMADSIEGKNGTPKMKLHSSTPFSELSTYSSVNSKHRRKRRKSKYVPRMRLRDFVVEDSPSMESYDDNNTIPTPLPRAKLSDRFLPEDSNNLQVQNEQVYSQPQLSSSSSSPPRKMKLRDSILGESEDDHDRIGTSKTREMAMNFESEDTHDQSNSRVQQLRKSLEPDRTPKMKVKGDFDRIDSDEKKVDDAVAGPMSRSSVGRLSKQFMSSPPTEQQLEDFHRPSKQVMDEFSKNIDPRILQEFEEFGQDPHQHSQPRYSGSPSSFQKDHPAAHVSAGQVGDNQQLGSSNVTEFFARIRGEQEQQEKEQQQLQFKKNSVNKFSGDNSSRPGTVSTSPSEDSEVVSEHSKGSNVSNLWSRGRNSISTMTSNLNTIAETKGKGFLSPDVIGKATTGLFNKFRGVPEDTQVEDEPTPTSIPKMHLRDSFHPTNDTPSSNDRVSTPTQELQQQEVEVQLEDSYPIGRNESIDDYAALQNYRKGLPPKMQHQNAYEPANDTTSNDRAIQPTKQFQHQEVELAESHPVTKNEPVDDYATLQNYKKGLPPVTKNEPVDDYATLQNHKKGLRPKMKLRDSFEPIQQETTSKHAVQPTQESQHQVQETEQHQMPGNDSVDDYAALQNYRKGLPPKMKLRDSFEPIHQESTISNSNVAEQPEQQVDVSSPNPLIPDDSIDDFAALRGYRKARASMSPEVNDNVSEASSFHALPNQIREVVQNSGGKVSPMAAVAAAAAAREQGHNLGLPPRFVSPSNKAPSEVSHQESSMTPSEFGAIIDTDGASLASGDHKGLDPSTLASLMMSPEILQKRLKQAIGCVEQQKWDQVLFLINANPWLAEMKELTTNQFLLHKLAFFGMGANPAPISLGEHLIEKFPSAVHKFDQDGNVPLHLAAASGNVGMIKLLGEKFSSGASIRNEDGMLPLHFAIASFAEFESQSDNSRPLATIKTVMGLFPQAIAIADNDGNLPLHVASECLESSVGVDVVYLLMDEADRQLQDPYGARFRNKIKMEELITEEDQNSQGDNLSTHIQNAASFMDDDEDLQCTMVLNDFDETPLLAAIKSNKGWEIIEALVSGPGGRKAALNEDSDGNNALHLLVGEFQDATAAMSILKIVPETVYHRNSEGILPIEMACMVMMPEEVILAIALVDLPINIADRDGIQVLKDRGASWVFLTCECDDHMVHIIEEILSICSFQQLQELCFWKEENAELTVINRATPKCRNAMNRALRFLGRFEFLGDGPLFSDMQTGFKAFDALDFGGSEEGKLVLLECYTNEFDFENRVFAMFDYVLDSQFVEEVNVYVEHLDDEEDPKEQQQRCVAIERPRVTLKEVVDGMRKTGGYDSGVITEKRMKYSAKICSVLKLIAKALRHLHETGVVHGNLCMDTCGKFDDSSWKLLERLGVQAIGKPFDTARFLNSFPPESLVASQEDGAVFDPDSPLVTFVQDVVADVSIDIWAFGKICYESLVGKPLIDFDENNSETPSDDVVALLRTCEWNVSNMETVFADLLQSGIGESGADMITACLFPSPSDRPVDMDEILNNPFWLEIRKHRSPRKNRKSGETVSTSVSLFTDVDRYEV